jgi:hypothetical protein
MFVERPYIISSFQLKFESVYRQINQLKVINIEK